MKTKSLKVSEKAHKAAKSHCDKLGLKIQSFVEKAIFALINAAK